MHTSRFVDGHSHLSVLEHLFAATHQDVREYQPNNHQERDLRVRKPGTVLMMRMDFVFFVRIVGEMAIVAVGDNISN